MNRKWIAPLAIGCSLLRLDVCIGSGSACLTFLARTVVK